jgi:hypothetical protein
MGYAYRKCGGIQPERFVKYICTASRISFIVQEPLISGEENEKIFPATFNFPGLDVGVINSGKDCSAILLDNTEELALDSIVGYVFSGADSVPAHRTVYSYDLNKYLISWVSKTYDASGKSWNNVEKHEFSHNEAGKETMKAKYVWDEDKHAWREDMKWIYDYNANGSMILKEGY